MKTLFLIIMILLLQSVPSYSKEILYECDLTEYGRSLFKVNKSKSKTKVFFRDDGKWNEWCGYENSTMETLEDSVICHIGMYQIDEYSRRKKQKIIFDFLFLTITNKSDTGTNISRCQIYKR